MTGKEGDREGDTMMSLKCPHVDCKLGDEGSRWETQKMTEAGAIQMLAFHVSANHTGSEGKHQEQSSVSKSKLEKICRPKLVMGCDQGDFAFFKTEWDRYKVNSGEKDATVLRDHLLMCGDEELRKTVHRLYGSRLQAMTLEELMEALETTAVEKQSDLLNLVELLELTQDREEPIKKFVARVRGKAGICNLSIECPSCHEKVSFSNNAILAAVVRGLYDAEILSKVKQLDLDNTIAFIEARETGHKSATALGKPAIQTQVVRVENQNKCGRCGVSGHSPKDGSDVMKSLCKAYGKKCNKCKGIGHFQKMCRSKMGKERSNKDEASEIL